jgi:hypothetical protein
VANDLTNEEAAYLEKVVQVRTFSDVPFRLDRVSMGLIQRGLLELDVSHYLAKWIVTPAGEQALQERSASA